MSYENKPPTLFDWLGLNDPREYPKGFGHFIGFFMTLVLIAFAALFVMAFAAAFVLVFGAFTGQGATLGLGALLVALLGAPFLIWRTVVAQNTLDTARKEAALKEEALFNDKINAAAKDLAARRQVTRVVIQDDKETILTEWEDDLVTRAAAIDLLEGLAIDAINRDDYPPAQRIARMLSTYIRELSRTYPPQPPPNLQIGGDIQRWASFIHGIQRPEMERAAQSLGRINPKDDAARAAFKPKNIDLRQCNLQCFDLRDGLFFGAQFRDAHLQAVDLEGAHLQCSDLTRADLREADLRKVQLQGAMLFAVKLSAGTQIDRCNLRGVAVFFVDNVTINTLRPHWDNIIAFLAELPPGAPDHWHTVSSDSFDPDQADADWRAWAFKHHPGIKIYPDYRDQDPV